MIAGGCSFCANWVADANIKKPELWGGYDHNTKRHIRFAWQYIEPFRVWSEIVSHKFNMELINTGRPGAGNDQIFHKLVDQIFTHKNKIKLVVVMWSQIVRKDIQIEKERWESTTFVLSKQIERINFFRSMYEIGALNEIVCIDYFFRYSMALTEICRSFDIKLVQCQGPTFFSDPNKLAEFQTANEKKQLYRNYKVDRKKLIKYFIDHIGFNYLETQDDFIDWPIFKEIGGNTFKDIMNTNKNKFYLSKHDPHPNGAAHQMYAEKIIDKINE